MGELPKGTFMKRRGVAKFLVEFVVVFGYGTGLFIALDFNLQEEILRGAQVFIDMMIPDALVHFGVALFLLLLLALSVRKAFTSGGPAGIFAIAMGLLAGLSSPMALTVGLAMLALALITGYIAVWGWRIR